MKNNMKLKLSVVVALILSVGAAEIGRNADGISDETGYIPVEHRAEDNAAADTQPTFSTEGTFQPNIAPAVFSGFPSFLLPDMAQQIPQQNQDFIAALQAQQQALMPIPLSYIGQMDHNQHLMLPSPQPSFPAILPDTEQADLVNTIFKYPSFDQDPEKVMQDTEKLSDIMKDIRLISEMFPFIPPEQIVVVEERVAQSDAQDSEPYNVQPESFFKSIRPTKHGHGHGNKVGHGAGNIVGGILSGIFGHHHYPHGHYPYPHGHYPSYPHGHYPYPHSNYPYPHGHYPSYPHGHYPYPDHHHHYPHHRG